MKLHIFVSDLKETTKTNVMNIKIESLSNNQNGIEYTWSNNGGDESEIQKMSKEDFAKLLCEHSDGEYAILTGFMGEDKIKIKDGHQISEDNYIDSFTTKNEFFNSQVDDNYDYCVDCLTKFIESQNKN